MDIVFCEAKCDDFDNIYPLFLQLWPTKQINKLELKKTFDRGVLSQTHKLIYVTKDEKVIAFCNYALINSLWQEGTNVYIYALVVDESYRGLGIGTEIINEVIHIARKQGAKRVELDSGFQRELAHKFYEKLGFEKRSYLFTYIL